VLNIERLECVYHKGGREGGEGIVPCLFTWSSNIWFLLPENNAVINTSFYKCCPGWAFFVYSLNRMKSIILLCLCVYVT